MHRHLTRLFTLVALGSLLGGCSVITKVSSGSGVSLQGTGPVKSEDRKIGDFDALEVSGEFEVSVKVGPASSLKLDAQENLLKAITSKVDGGVLRIESEDDLVSDKPIRLTITTPKLSSVSGSGAVNMRVEGVVSKTFVADFSGASKLKVDGKADEVKLEGSGAAEFVWDGLTAKSLAIHLSGGGNALASGSADSLSIDMSGGSTFKGERLLTKVATVQMSGGCDVAVHATETLRIDANGGGSVRYSGDPKVSQEISGGVEVSKIP